MSFDSRPYVFLKVATSFDGCLDDLSNVRLVFSPPEDMVAVDQLRAEFDAIFVGAETVRKDNPRLVLRDESLRKNRIERGLSPDPMKVCLTASGNLDSSSAFFKAGDSERVIYAPSDIAVGLQTELAGRAIVVPLTASREGGNGYLPILALLSDLKQRGVSRLFVEGGSTIIRQLLEADVVDGFRLAISSKCVAEAEAPRCLHSQLSSTGRREFRLDACEHFPEMIVLTGSFHPPAA